MFHKKNQKWTRTDIPYIPIYSKDVFLACGRGTEKDFEESMYSINNAKEMQYEIASVYDEYERIKFCYIDKDYLDWVKEMEYELNDASLQVYITMLAARDKEKGMMKQWDKIAKDCYQLKVLLFHITGEDKKCMAKKIDTSILTDYYASLGIKIWASPNFINDKEFYSCRERITDVGREYFAGNKIKLGIINQEEKEFDKDDVLLLPYVVKETPSYDIKIKNNEFIKPELIPAEIVRKIAKDSSLNSKIIPITYLSLYSFQIDEMNVILEMYDRTLP